MSVKDRTSTSDRPSLTTLPDGRGVIVIGGRMHSVLDATDPFAPAKYGPAGTDGRHRMSISAIVPIRAGIQIAAIEYYRSALPVNVIEGIGEIFNVFDAANPGGINRQRLLAPATANPDFMRPTSFAGDFQQPEQRVGQIGVRWSFGKQAQ